MAKRTAVKQIKEKVRGLVPSSAYGRLDVAYDEYLRGLDPVNRTEVQIALACSPDHRFREFLTRMGLNLLGKEVSLPAIAKMCGIELQEFNEWWPKASTQRAIALAQINSPSLIADMAQDAASRHEVCGRCDGLTWIGAPAGLDPATPGYRVLELEPEPKWIRDCPSCVAGKVRVPGDEFSREKLLESAGLINRKGAGITITQNFGGQALPSAVGRMSAVTVDVEPE